MMHVAIHDALNTIKPKHHRYIFDGKRSASAHPIAAAAQAAHAVLVAQYPGAQVRLDAELARWLAEVPDATPKARGIELGNASAAAVLLARNGDRWDEQGSYQFRDAAGQYQTTPPWDGFVAQPGFRSAKPFVLASPDQFRPPPPPPLADAAYTLAFNEVKDYGALQSAVRDEDQSAYAVWWMEFSEGSVNRLARKLMVTTRTDLWAANRMFALMNMALFDVYIATWDAKYEHNHWRPYTAVRAATADGNADTAPDADWEPLRPTPPTPEYTSAHAAGCAAAFAVLARTLGEDVAFTMETLTAPPGMPTRSFTSFDAAADECADSRVHLGWHYRYSTDAGLAMGRAVAAYVLEHALTER
jgi:hypothetical protein